MGKQFKNPHNDYVEEISGLAWLWTLFFGCIYFAVKGIWKHVFISLILAILTGGLSWVIYPFFARGILEKHYLVKGWKEVSPPTLPIKCAVAHQGGPSLPFPFIQAL